MNSDYDEARTTLLKMFADDIRNGKHPVLYTILKHVSVSGMMRHIDVFYIKDNKPILLNRCIEKLGLFKRAKSYNAKNADSLRVSGCGMDMGFDLVYNLSRSLYPNGFNCLGENCHSNDHINGDKNRKPHIHINSGYLLNQQWM